MIPLHWYAQWRGTTQATLMKKNGLNSVKREPAAGVFTAIS